MAKFKVIISGGGTGGHIFPAISIANAIRQEREDAQILFVGAKGRMEMEKVPAAGYQIKGIPARGLKRPLYSLSNIKTAIDYLRCKRMAKRIIKNFEPNVVVGVGGYASAAVVSAAGNMKIPVVLQEQNSFAGMVNKRNGSKADKICVAYDNMEKFFPKDKIILTGNPIRKEIVRCSEEMRREGIKFYNLTGKKRIVFVVGGSLGCRTLNNAVMKAIQENKIDDHEIIWQCGKIYKKEVEQFLKLNPAPNVVCYDFIERMDLAYAAADIVVSRAGAGTISELCIAGKATIFVPSPVVAEDHQTHNAMALVDKNAAEIIKDDKADIELFPKIKHLLKNPQRIKELEENILKLAKPNASTDIAKIVIACGNNGILEIRKDSQKKYDNIYFIGIGGIGMSAIARYYNKKGYKVAGYDRSPSELTKELENEGIEIHYKDDISKVPENKEGTLVIYTPAIPTEMEELIKVQSEGYEVIKRSKALGHIAQGQRCLAISGSHGKTTTSTLLAHIYTDAGVGCNAFLGGISKNYNSNLLVSPTTNFIAEADEFDRSFLQLHPHIAVVTATDPDHLDIYGTVEKMREAFAQFASQVDANGYVIIKCGTIIDRKKIKAKVLNYALTNQTQGDIKADFYASDITPIKVDGVENGLLKFTINYPKDIVGGSGKIENCFVGIPGWVNIENSIAASAVALLEGIDPQKIKEALANFKGVKRRMDIHINTPKIVYIDDYAHHPEELHTTISSIRESFPNRKITGIFQPHLYTRTRDLANDFAKSLSSLDSLILLDIYPARELPIEGVTSKIIFDKVTITDKKMINKEELLDLIKKENDSNNLDIVVTFGAGNIDQFITPITKLLTNE